MPVMVVERQALARVFKLLWGFDRMRIVVSQHSFAVRLVERRGITNAVRDTTVGFDVPSLGFDPVAVALIDDRAHSGRAAFQGRGHPPSAIFY